MRALGAATAGEFPVSWCAPCGRDVLTHVHLDDVGGERRRCLHCDAEMDPEAVRWVSGAKLEALGYAEPGDGQGCGRPGCGQGACSNTERSVR